MLGGTPNPMFHPKIVKLTPLTISIVIAAVAALHKSPISGY